MRHNRKETKEMKERKTTRRKGTYLGASSEMCGRMRKRFLPRLLVPGILLNM
jgi:hypothetical protein